MPVTKTPYRRSTGRTGASPGSSLLASLGHPSCQALDLTLSSQNSPLSVLHLHCTYCAMFDYTHRQNLVPWSL
jgi:hypothetical protein